MARLPTGAVTTPLLTVTAPPAAVPETNASPAGRVSVTTTPVAGDGPLLTTLIVKVNVLPAWIEAVEALSEVIATSAEGMIVVVAEPVLFEVSGSTGFEPVVGKATVAVSLTDAGVVPVVATVMV